MPVRIIYHARLVTALWQSEVLTALLKGCAGEVCHRLPGVDCLVRLKIAEEVCCASEHNFIAFSRCKGRCVYRNSLNHCHVAF